MLPSYRTPQQKAGRHIPPSRIVPVRLNLCDALVFHFNPKSTILSAQHTACLLPFNYGFIPEVKKQPDLRWILPPPEHLQ